MAHAHNMATAITGSTAEGGSITRLESAEVSRLESTEDAGRGMPATCTDISGGSTKLEIKWLGNAMVASGATYMMTGNTGVASMTAEDYSRLWCGGHDGLRLWNCGHERMTLWNGSHYGTSLRSGRNDGTRLWSGGQAYLQW